MEHDEYEKAAAQRTMKAILAAVGIRPPVEPGKPEKAPGQVIREIVHWWRRGAIDADELAARIDEQIARVRQDQRDRDVELLDSPCDKRAPFSTKSPAQWLKEQPL